MEMTPHLNESELAEFISDPSRGFDTHLDVCDACRNEVAGLRETAIGMKSIAEKPQEFWDMQCAIIRTQIATLPSPTTRASRRLAWVPVLALLILAGLLLTGGNPVTTPVVSQAAVDPDHELLLAVEDVMQSNGPDALEPASYFIEQISQPSSTNSISTIRNQEKHNAN